MPTSTTASPLHALDVRQPLSKRQSATVDALLTAGMEAARESGFEHLSLRDIAARAGVTHTTAYNYFASREHVMAEAYLRMLEALPTPPVDESAPVAKRLIDALRGASELFAVDDAFAQAALTSLVAQDPAIARIRTAVGYELYRRIRVAVGEHADRRLAEGPLMLYSGAMLEAGMGYFPFTQVVERVGTIVAFWGVSES